jgi:hypothetical protein
VAIAQAEVRFPVIRNLNLGLLPISLPPVDGLVFFDAGIAWSRGQSTSFTQPDNYDDTIQRYVLRSYGAGIRLNLFGFALLRWDYAIPLDRDAPVCGRCGRQRGALPLVPARLHGQGTCFGEVRSAALAAVANVTGEIA